MSFGNFNFTILLGSSLFLTLLVIGILLMVYVIYRECNRLDSVFRACLLLIIMLFISIILLSIGPLFQSVFASFYQSGLSAPFIYFADLNEIDMAIIFKNLLAFGIIPGIYITSFIAFGNTFKQYKYYGIISAITILNFIDVYFCFIIPTLSPITNYLLATFCNIIGGAIAGYSLGYLYNYFNNIIDKKSIENKREETKKILKYIVIIIIGLLFFIVIFIIPIDLKVHIILDDWNTISFIYKGGNLSKEKEVSIEETKLVSFSNPSNTLNIKLIPSPRTIRDASENINKLLVPLTISIIKGNKIRQIYKGQIPEGDLTIEGATLFISLEGDGLTKLYVPYGKRVNFTKIETPISISAKDLKNNTTTMVRVPDGNVKLSEVVPKTHLTIKYFMNKNISLKQSINRISLPTSEIINSDTDSVITMSLGGGKLKSTNYDLLINQGMTYVNIWSKEKSCWLNTYGQPVNTIMIIKPNGIIYYGNNNMNIIPSNETLYIGGETLNIKHDNDKIIIDGHSNKIMLGDLMLSYSLWQQMSSQLQAAILGFLIGLLGGYFIGTILERGNLRK